MPWHLRSRALALLVACSSFLLWHPCHAQFPAANRDDDTPASRRQKGVAPALPVAKAKNASSAKAAAPIDAAAPRPKTAKASDAPPLLQRPKATQASNEPLAPRPKAAKASDDDGDEDAPRARYTIELPECVHETRTTWQATLPLKFPPPAKKAPAREEEDEGGEPQQQQPPQAKIPNIVHFVFGYKEVPTFDFVNFASIASVLAVIRPEAVMVHCFMEPIGFFWDLIKPYVQLVRARKVTRVWGRDVRFYTHKADIIRLETLLAYGGIYIDADVIALRPFDELLRTATADVILGAEGEKARVGVGNGVILAAPDAEFLLKWLNKYRTFDKRQWNFHSAVVPALLAKDDPELLDQRPYTAFHWPLWDDAGIKLMLDSYEYDYKENYAVHMWTNAMRKSPYKGFSMPWCFECHSTLVSMLHAYVPDPLFTVVISCSNQADYIKEAMGSIVEQSFPAWELIVVDDASQDNCGRAAERFAKKHGFYNKGRFKLIVNPVAKGTSETRNIGIRQARGVWLCSLDAADKVHEDYLRTAAEVMSLEPDLQMLSSNEQMFGESTDTRNAPPFDTAALMTSWQVPSTSLFLRSLWEDAEGFSRALPWGFEDYDFWLKLLEIGPRYRKLDGELVYYRYGIKSLRDKPSFADEMTAMVRSKHPDIFHVAMLLPEHKKIMAMSNVTRARLDVMQKQPDLNEVDSAWVAFWLALADMGQNKHDEAAERLSGILDVEPLQWQPTLYYAQCLCKAKGPSASTEVVEQLGAMYSKVHITLEFETLKRNCHDRAR